MGEIIFNQILKQGIAVDSANEVSCAHVGGDVGGVLRKDALTLLATTEAFPVTAVYVDVAKGNIEEKPPIDDGYIDKLWEGLQTQIEYVKLHNLDVVSYYNMFLKVEPYCNFAQIKNMIKEELKKYE